MKKVQGEIEEILYWRCPYKNCGEYNEEVYYGQSELECFGCKKTVKVKI